MKYTKEYLLEAAQKFIHKKVEREPSISAVMLIGSLRSYDHQIDHPIDVDLLVIQDGPVVIENELVRISDDHHLDIHYDDVSAYENPKLLRADGLRGWAVWNAEILYQRDRFFEFTQSTVRSQFDEPKNVVERMRYFCSRSRSFWLENSSMPQRVSMDEYLNAVADAGNALACINREPLSIRTLLSDFFEITRSHNISEINGKILACMSSELSTELVTKNISLWKDLFTEGVKYPADMIIHPLRVNYFLSSIVSLASSSQPITSFWPFLFTLGKMPIQFSENKKLIDRSKNLKTSFGFSPEGMNQKLDALDLLLEDIEGIVEQIQTDYSVE